MGSNQIRKKMSRTICACIDSIAKSVQYFNQIVEGN